MSKNTDLEINELLEELKEKCGIEFSIADDSISDEALKEKLHDMLRIMSAADAKHSARHEDFKQYILLDSKENEAKLLAQADILQDKYHINRGLFVDLYLISFKDKYTDLDVTVLGSLFDPSASDIVHMSDDEIVVLQYCEETTRPEEHCRIAQNIIDMIETEALHAVSVSYDVAADKLCHVPCLYAHAKKAQAIGSGLLTGQKIFAYNDMGFEKLLYSISSEDREEYISDNLSSVDFKSFDEETINTITTFFDCDLNIAETSRALYLHRNTLVYRLDKFEKDTGLDLRNFKDAIKCQIGLIFSRM